MYEVLTSTLVFFLWALLICILLLILILLLLIWLRVHIQRRGYIHTKVVTLAGRKVTIPQGLRKDMVKVLELEASKTWRPPTILPLLRAYEQILGQLPTSAYPAFCAVLQVNLGRAYFDLPTGDRSSNLKQAIAYYKQAIAYYQQQTSVFRISRATHRECALIQNNLGLAYRNLPTGDRDANLKQAIAYFQEALHFWALKVSRSWTPYNQFYALAQNNLGLAYLHLPTGDRIDDLKKAMAFFQNALNIWTPIAYPSQHAMVQHNLGATYVALYLSPLTEDHSSYLQEAIGCYRAALRLRTPETDPVSCAATNSALASFYFSQSEWQMALDAYQAAINAREQLYRAGLSSESKTAETSVTTEIYRYAAFAAARCGKATQALLILEQGKTRLLAEALHLRVRRPTFVPDDLWAAFENAGTLIRTAVFDNRNTDTPNKEDDRIEFYRVREQTVTHARVALDAAIERIRIYEPSFLQPMKLPAIQEQLSDEHTVFIAFCITDKGSVGLVVRKYEEVQAVEVPNFTQQELHQLFSDWLEGYNRYRSEHFKTAPGSWQLTITKVLATLGEHLLAPILATLSADIKRIVFLPSAELFLFPLHATPLLGSDSKLVCDRYEISYAPSVEVLANLSTKSVQGVTPDLYAVINPQADPQLFFTPIAGAAIAKLFPECDVDIGRVGTKQNVIAKANGRAYVLFCCHGGYDWDEPTRSGLILADDRLTLTDLQSRIANLSHTRLVTLVACEVGITDVLKGSAEEYVGVPAGFMLAGVSCIVSSLWAVLDISTALLMERFYHNHLVSGMEFASALREPQIWLRELSIGKVAEYTEECYQKARQKDKTILFKFMRFYRQQEMLNADQRPFEHPYYWAAFTVNGRPDVRSLTPTPAVGEKDRTVATGHLKRDSQSRGVEARQEQAGQPMDALFSPSRMDSSSIDTIDDIVGRATDALFSLSRIELSLDKARKGTLIRPLLISLIILLIGGSCGLFFYIVGSYSIAINNANRAQATATDAAYTSHQIAANIAHATATAQVYATATATAKVVADNPDPYPPTNGRLALYDPLRQPSNWTNESDTSLGGTCQFINGSYSISETKPLNIFPCYPKNSDFRDFAFEVQMKIIKGECGGMIFRAGQVGFYVYIICWDGAYDLHLFTSSNQKDLRNTHVSGVHTGLNQSNTIAVVADGSKIDLYVNNQRIDSIQDTTSDHGGIALLAFDLSNPTEVIYTYARVWTL